MSDSVGFPIRDCPKCVGGLLAYDELDNDMFCVNCGWRRVQVIQQTGRRTTFAEEHPQFGQTRDGYHSGPRT